MCRAMLERTRQVPTRSALSCSPPPVISWRPGLRALSPGQVPDEASPRPPRERGGPSPHRTVSPLGCLGVCPHRKPRLPPSAPRSRAHRGCGHQNQGHPTCFSTGLAARLPPRSLLGQTAHQTDAWYLVTLGVSAVPPSPPPAHGGLAPKPAPCPCPALFRRSDPASLGGTQVSPAFQKGLPRCSRSLGTETAASW